MIGAPRALKGAVGIYEWHFVAARGPSPFDRIGLHRIASGPAAPAHPGIVVLYLPGTNMNGEVAVDAPRYSMLVYLAAHGVDVWAMDYRTHFVPPDTPPGKLAVMIGWTSRMFDGDIEAAAAFVSAETHQEKLFIAGFSRGATFAYLFAASHPRTVAGLVILDGFIMRRPAPATPAGRVADDIGGHHLTYDKRQAIAATIGPKLAHGRRVATKCFRITSGGSHSAFCSFSLGGGVGGLSGLSPSFDREPLPICFANSAIQWGFTNESGISGHGSTA